MWLLSQNRRNDLLIILIIIFLSLPSIFPLFQKGFFQSDDGEWMVIRFSAFHQAFRDGQIPVRFLERLNYGYGYPVANFLYPGFMYLAEIPKILGFGFVESIKIIFGVSIIGSIIFAYLWLSKLFDKISAFTGALVYLYSPYHLFDLYKRGSMGEVLSLAVVPFILWQLERKSLFWSTIGIAFLLLSHNTLSLLFLPIIIAYGLLRPPFTVYHLLFTILLGLGISSFFWIPAIYELQHTVFSKTPISDFTQYFADLQTIGVSTIAILLLFLFLFITKKINVIKYKLTLLFFISGILSLFFSTSLSSPLWEVLPVSLVQFPFRFLSILLLSMSFLAACSLLVMNKKLQFVVRFFLILFILISSWSFFVPSKFFNKGEGFYTTNEATTTIQDEYMPKWVKVKPKEHFKNKIEIIKGSASINSLSYNSKRITFLVNSQTGGKVRVNTIYYPGWKAIVNGSEAVINYSNERGLMELSVTKGKNNIVLIFEETPVRLVSDIVSILSLLIILSMGVYYKYTGIFVVAKKIYEKS